MLGGKITLSLETAPGETKEVHWDLSLAEAGLVGIMLKELIGPAKAGA